MGAVLLTLVIALRYRVGCDWIGYIISMDQVNYAGPGEGRW